MAASTSAWLRPKKWLRQTPTLSAAIGWPSALVKSGTAAACEPASAGSRPEIAFSTWALSATV